MKPISSLKKEAKSLKKKDSIQLSQAQNIIAIKYGYKSWKDLVSLSAKNCFESRKDYITGSKRVLVSLGLDFAEFVPTDTVIDKATFDATHPVRALFKSEKFHDYSAQSKGQDSKIIKNALFLNHDESISDTFDFDNDSNLDIRLYRPNTKDGDPRMWFSGFTKYAKEWDRIAVIIINNHPVLINLSWNDLHEDHSIILSQLKLLIKLFKTDDSCVSEELLAKLKVLAKNGLLKATTSGSTAIGMTIEHALGLPPNSSKKPDYKGIEIKSGRGGSNRTTLFAQVADWKQSKLTSSKAILEQFGYQREEDFKLYCSLSCLKFNSQGLRFEYRENEDALVEIQDEFGDVAVWPAELLKRRLLEKHKETFWIRAESVMKDDVEYFKLISVIHTKNPLSNQLLPLLQDGVITMDHLIKKRGSDGKVSEKGPLFKMDKKNLGLLFPDPVTYSLL